MLIVSVVVRMMYISDIDVVVAVVGTCRLHQHITNCFEKQARKYLINHLAGGTAIGTELRNILQYLNGASSKAIEI